MSCLDFWYEEFWTHFITIFVQYTFFQLIYKGAVYLNAVTFALIPNYFPLYFSVKHHYCG